jgi:4-oxalocrotonate tautomerase
MPTVMIIVREGKTLDQKRAAAKGVTNALVEAFGVTAEQVGIQMIDQKAENIALGGILLPDRQKAR